MQVQTLLEKENNFKMKQFNFSVDLLIDCLIQVPTFIYGLKTSGLMLVHFAYVYKRYLYNELKNRSSFNLTDPDFHYKHEQLRASMTESYRIMVDYGYILRGSGLNFALSISLTILVLPFAYYLSNWFYRKELRCCRGIEFFMQDHEEEMKRLNERVDKCIVRTKISVMSQMKILAANEKINSTNYINDSIDGLNPRLISCVEFMVKLVDEGEIGDGSPSSESNEKLIRAFSSERHRVRKWIDLLDTEISRLHELQFTAEKQSIWPSNRNMKWRKHMLTLWTHLTIIAMITFCIVCHTCQQLAIRALINEIRLSDFSEGHLVCLGWKGYMDVFFFKLGTFIAIDWICKPYAQLQISFVDQMQYLRSMIEKFRNLRDRLISLNGHEDGRRSHELARICDSQLLDYYVSYQVLGNEIRFMFKRTEHSIVYLYGSLFLLISNVFVLSFSDTKLRRLLLIIAMILQLSINLVLMPMAILNKECQYISKLIYHIIARAEQLNAYSSELPKLSSHSLNLWRKLIADDKLYSKNFSCDLLGFAQLNYETVLRLNLYIVSIIVLVFSSK